MLTSSERELLGMVSITELQRDLEGITAFDRLSGNDGELCAVDYICTQLAECGVSFKVHNYTALVSNPISSHLEYYDGYSRREIPSKTRSFSGSTSQEQVEGELIYISQSSLPSDMNEYLLLRLKAEQDLRGKVVISEALTPLAVLAVQNRGAIGYIQYWNGKEELIHEGIVNPVWGTPLPGETELQPAIPVLAVNLRDGQLLRDLTYSRSVRVVIATVLEEKVCSLPTVEAFIPPQSEDATYLLIGNHLDSWYKGVTDNGTGNAMALALTRILHKERSKLHFGVRIAWWPGHSNGRYAGSALYARENFSSLLKNCLAYTNIDMPGLRGATDYTKINTGADLFKLTRSVIQDVTGQTGTLCNPLRSWDQSFQNLGISPHLVWASTLPDGHADGTNNSFMSWWWHTEEDLLAYYDAAVLLKDTQVYLLAVFRLLAGNRQHFDISGLLEKACQEMRTTRDKYKGYINYCAATEALTEVNTLYKRGGKSIVSLTEGIPIVRKINQILYAQKEASLQDWALEQSCLPGLQVARLLTSGTWTEKSELLIRHYGKCQENRIIALCNDLLGYLSRK